MTHGGDRIDRYLAQLARELALPRALRRRVLQETESHLRAASDALAAGGRAPDEAAQLAVERFGDPRALARQVETDRPPRSATRRWLLLLLAAAAASGLAGAALGVSRSPGPYGIVSQGERGPVARGMAGTGVRAFAVRLDPRTLRVLHGPRLALGPYDVALAVDPSSSLAALGTQRLGGVIRLVDLAAMRRLRDVRVARAPWRIKLVAWASPDRLVAVVQTMRGAHAQIVDRRRLLVLDTRSGRLVAQRSYARHGLVSILGATHGRLLLLWSPSREGGRWLQLDQVAGDGSLHVTTIDEGLGRGLRRTPGAALDPAGRRVLVVVPAGPVAEVDLPSGRVHMHPGLPERARPGDWLGRRALLVDGDVLAVTGNDLHTSGRPKTTTAAGLTLLDTRTWLGRKVDDAAVSATVAGGNVVVAGEPTPSGAGTGLSAYAANGRRAWHALDGRAAFAQAIGSVVLAWLRPVGPPIGGHPPTMAILDPDTGGVIARRRWPAGPGGRFVAPLLPVFAGTG